MPDEDLGWSITGALKKVGKVAVLPAVAMNKAVLSVAKPVIKPAAGAALMAVASSMNPSVGAGSGEPAAYGVPCGLFARLSRFFGGHPQCD